MDRIDALEKEIISLRKELDLLYYLLMNSTSSSLSNPLNVIKKLTSYYYEELSRTNTHLTQTKLDLYHRTKDTPAGHNNPDSFIQYLRKETEEYEQRKQTISHYIDILEKTAEHLERKYDNVEKKFFPTKQDRIMLQQKHREEVYRKVKQYFDRINGKE